MDARSAMRLMKRQAKRAGALHRRGGGPGKWVGKIVKAGFRQSRNRSVAKEWMWLKVTGVREDGKLVGRLGNTPVYATYVSYGDEVAFSEDDIIGVE